MKKKVMCYEKEYNSIKELSDEYNISAKTLRTRVQRGYSYEEAISLTKKQARQNSLNNIKVNNKPLDKEVVTKRMKKCGYDIIDYTYKNNQTRMLCYDSNGYKVYMCLGGAEKGVQAQRFSVTHNEDNFIYNANLFAKLHEYRSTVEDWRMGSFNQPDILCTCQCGNKFWRKFNIWYHNKSDICASCRNISSKYEDMVENELNNLHIKYEKQKRFEDCRNKRKLPFDFYLPLYNCCIEVDGEQHYDKERVFGATTKEEKEELFNLRKELDGIKTQYCENNNIKLLRIPYWEFNQNEDYKKSILSILNT